MLQVEHLDSEVIALPPRNPDGREAALADPPAHRERREVHHLELRRLVGTHRRHCSDGGSTRTTREAGRKQLHGHFSFLKQLTGLHLSALVTPQRESHEKRHEKRHEKCNNGGESNHLVWLYHHATRSCTQSSRWCWRRVWALLIAREVGRARVAALVARQRYRGAWRAEAAPLARQARGPE